MTTIGGSLVVKGELTGEEDLRIEGRVEGPVLVRNATLTIGEGAQLRGDVRGVRVVIHGTVAGTVSATERIELRPTAVVAGALSANQVVIADTATFNGQIDMGRRTIAARVAQFKTGRA